MQKSILDVREVEDYTSGHLERSCNIRVSDIEERMNELPPKVSHDILRLRYQPGIRIDRNRSH
jgi:rhodanese-related sulfurtransferase